MNRIRSITVERDLTVYERGKRVTVNHHIFFQRRSADGATRCRMFESNPVLDSTPRISRASVQRARRALKAFSQQKGDSLTWHK